MIARCPSKSAVSEARVPILQTLKSRPQFLAVRGGRRSSTPAFLIEARERPAAENGDTARFGFTITKKIGNAVTRNRIRRRLKAAFAATAPVHARASCDYVVVARHAALDRPFAALLEDVARAFASLHDNAKRNRANEDRPRPRKTDITKGST